MLGDPCEQFRLDGRICFLSGATGLLGRLMAEALAAAGAHVWLNARSEGALNALVAELRSMGWKASSACFDITNELAVQSAMTQIRQDHGRLDKIGRASCRERV